jgi:cytochrome b561
MRIKNTSTHFGIITILFHWVMAVLILGMLTLGIYMTRIPVSMQKLQYYGWHKEFGMLILMLAIVRLTWRLRNINPNLANLPAWEEFTARFVHWLFYGFMFAMPVTGWLLTSAAGLPVSFFGLFVIPTLTEPNEENRILFTTIHTYIAYGLMATLFLHIAAALKHFVINRDKILQRMMWP